MKTKEQDKTAFNRKMQKLALTLFFSGLVLVLLHIVFYDSQAVYNDESWLVIVESSHRLDDDNTIINLQPPFESQYIRQAGRNIRYTGFKLLPPASSVENRRAIRLKSRQPGMHQMQAEFSLQLSQQDHFKNKKKVVLTQKQLDYYLQRSAAAEASEEKITSLLISLNLENLSSSEVVDAIFNYVKALANSEAQSLRNFEDIIDSKSASQLEKAVLMLELGRFSGVPTRLVTGLELKDDPSALPRHWVEFYIDERWRAIYMSPQYTGDVPYNFVAFDKTGTGIVSSARAHNFELDISIERKPITLHGHDAERGEWYQMLMFDRLDVETREQLALLMLLPLGTLLCSLIRQLLSIHSYGVFTPTMLALAFVYAEIGTTLLILFITLCIVYFGRPAFNGGMSRTPRLSIIFTLVACSMVMGVSMLDYFNIAADGQLVLLPIVIITSLLDRFFSTIESNGYQSAIVRLIWTLILTLAVLPVIQLEKIGLWLLRYPEAHLITLSLLLMLTYSSLPRYKLPGWLGFLSEPDRQPAEKSRRKNDEALD